MRSMDALRVEVRGQAARLLGYGLVLAVARTLTAVRADVS